MLKLHMSLWGKWNASSTGAETRKQLRSEDTRGRGTRPSNKEITSGW